MKLAPKRKIADQVVVITGASSGIGRECAIEMVRRGAVVVAAARNREALESLAASLVSSPGRVHTMVADVTDQEQVERLARTTVERFGRIDTWVNNAAVIEYATFSDSTAEEIRRIMEVNFIGQVHGMKAALEHMRSQGRGTIINMGSVTSRRALPLLSAYAASKHAIAGITEAARMELEYEGAGIDVTLVMPACINTPFYEHARAKLGGKLPAPFPPVYQPRSVAQAVLYAAEHRKRDIVVGGAGEALILLQKLSPRLVDWYMVQGGRFFRKQRSSTPDDGVDNLFHPSRGPGHARGPYNEGALEISLYTKVFEMHPVIKAAAIALIAPLAADAVLATLLGVGAISLAARILQPLTSRKPREERAAPRSGR